MAESSTEMASLAGRIIAGGNPLDNDQVLLAVAMRLNEQGFTFGAKATEKAAIALRPVLGVYFDNMLSLAGSVLSQAERAPPSLQHAATIAAGVFRSYELLHIEKGTAEGLEKAGRNADAAHLLEQAIDDKPDRLVSPPIRLLALLKGQAPAGLSNSDLYAAVQRGDDGVDARTLIALINGGWVVEREGKMYASDKLVACAAIEAAPWPESIA